MSDCLPSLVASLPGIIIICGLIALFCIVLFDTTPARGPTRTVKFKEPEKIECGICNAIAKPNAPQEDVEFYTNDFLFKVEKEISPDSIVILLQPRMPSRMEQVPARRKAGGIMCQSFWLTQRLYGNFFQCTFH